MDITVRTTVGQPAARIDPLIKRLRMCKHVGDLVGAGILHAKLVSSIEAHVNLTSIEAWKVSGVREIITSTRS
ncbi:hypothetical protein [Sporosarcina sp. NPDC096371]|uniref:hypothetical protein n=1 Tax=Sporosarcina sp. NPDC096371 TaxID=3364530 RepID=UPI0038131A6D